MTEIPEHLLARSRERRKALGLGGGDEGAEAPTAPAPAEPSAAAPAAAAPAAAPAPARGAETPAKPPPPPPPYVAAELRRPKVPWWAVATLASLPVWAIIYAGILGADFTPEAAGPVALGAEVYTSAGCAGCHGANGGGGAGRQFTGGELIATFPDAADQLEFVRIGTQGVGEGNPYGDPNRPGGPHIAGSFGVMPAFGDILSEEELVAVVCYERVQFGGQDPAAIEGIDCVGGGETAAHG